MKHYLKNCFLAFLCLYRSKYLGLRRSCLDHPELAPGKDLVPSPPLADTTGFWAILGLGDAYPRTLDFLLFLSSMAVEVKVLRRYLADYYTEAFFRSARIRAKVKSSRLAIRDGSRHVCMPSYIKPKEFP